MSTQDWSHPVRVDGASAALGGDMAKLLPPWESIPETFRRLDSEPWGVLAAQWFFFGLKGKFVAKPGIELPVAVAHLSAILRSWAPKHEHKEAGVAYLMSLWFERFEPDGRAA
jgi:hypothetical protein